MSQGNITIRSENGAFVLEATEGDRRAAIDLSSESLYGLSLALAQLLSHHEQEKRPENPQPSLLDIVSPDVSFEQCRIGVAMIVKAHGIAPIRLTFPIQQGGQVAKSFVEALHEWADGAGLA